jgi:hypothetical protein
MKYEKKVIDWVCVRPQVNGTAREKLGIIDEV